MCERVCSYRTKIIMFRQKIARSPSGLFALKCQGDPQLFCNAQRLPCCLSRRPSPAHAEPLLSSDRPLISSGIRVVSFAIILFSPFCSDWFYGNYLPLWIVSPAVLVKAMRESCINFRMIFFIKVFVIDKSSLIYGNKTNPWKRYG